MSGRSDARDAIRVLYKQHKNDIYRYARLTLGDPDAALDIVQDVFLRAFRSWDGFRQEAAAKTWLMRIARNAVYDLLRRRKLERRLLADPAAANVEEISDPSLPGETAMELGEALASLKRTYREVFVLRHVDGCSVAETAAVLGWTQSSVKATDRRAIAKLRAALGDEDGADGTADEHPAHRNDTEVTRTGGKRSRRDRRV